MSEFNDSVWRKAVDSYRGAFPEEGEEPPELEKISKVNRGRPRSKRFTVQKITTDLFVYTDVEGKTFSQMAFQELAILGEMTEAKLKKFLEAEQRRRQQQ